MRTASFESKANAPSQDRFLAQATTSRRPTAITAMPPTSRHPIGSAKIQAPTAICSPELEQFFPGQPEKLLKLLKTRKKLLKFTIEEGAELHCEPMAPQLRNERVFDWLETNMEPVG